MNGVLNAPKAFYKSKLFIIQFSFILVEPKFPDRRVSSM